MISDERDEPLLDLYRNTANERASAAATHAILREAARHAAHSRQRLPWRSAAVAAAAAMLLMAVLHPRTDGRNAAGAGLEMAPAGRGVAQYLVRLQRPNSSDSEVANYLRTQDLTLVRQTYDRNGEP